MSIAWTVTDRSGDGTVLVEAQHVGGSRWYMSESYVSATGADVTQPAAAIPLDTLDEMRKLRDQRVDERIDEEAQV